MVYKKSHFIILYAFLLITIFSFCSCSCIDTNVTVKNIESNQDELQLTKIKNAKEFFDIENGYVYFGRETCSTCKSFKPTLSEVAKEENIVVYYFDTGYFRENALLPENELQEIFSNYQVLSVPIIIEIRDGQTCNTFIPIFNEQKDNVDEIRENARNFLSHSSERKETH